MEMAATPDKLTWRAIGGAIDLVSKCAWGLCRKFLRDIQTLAAIQLSTLLVSAWLFLPTRPSSLSSWAPPHWMSSTS